jgi:hypothetical protein
MSAQNPHPTKLTSKTPLKSMLTDNLKSITLKGSTEGSCSNPESIVAVED